MKREFDRNGFRLTDRERAELWQQIDPSARRRAPWRPRLVPALATGAVALAATALVLMNFPRRGADLPAPPLTHAVQPSAAPAAPPQSVTVAPSAESRRESAGGASKQTGGDRNSGSAPPPAREPARTAEPPAAASPVVAPAVEAPARTAATGTAADAVERSAPAPSAPPGSAGGDRPAQVRGAVQEQRIAPDMLEKLAAESRANGGAGQAGAGGSVYQRGGRSGELTLRADGAPAEKARRTNSGRLTLRPGAAPPAAPRGGRPVDDDEERDYRARCWVPAGDPAFDAMTFRHSGVNPFVLTDADPLSTFALDVDNASYTMTRAFLERGELPPAAAVRVEECVNFFAQDYPAPDGDDFRIAVDGAPSPFGEGYHLLRIGLRARDVRPAARRPAVLTFVIDVSGSMRREGRLELVKRALRVLLDELDADDTVGIVTYTTNASVALPPTPVSRRSLIEAVIARLEPQNSTNVNEGLAYGYRMARGSFRPGAVNRIVLCSDGVANESITVADGILDDVRREADAGIHLTAIGVGMGNYNDVLLEQLADRGDGNYYYVDDLDEARRVFRRNLVGTLQTVARDAKVQVEFDPDVVQRWRLLGYENRAVADRDFRNDAVDAGEVGAGQQVTALYEVKLASDDGRTREERRGRRGAGAALGVVRLRYRAPESEGRQAGLARELSRSITPRDLSRSFAAAAPRLRLDAAVAEFAELLRGSYWARGGDMDRVARLAADLADQSPRDGAVAEFARLARLAADLRPEDHAGDAQE